jgi:hypothetical protein
MNVKHDTIPFKSTNGHVKILFFWFPKFAGFFFPDSTELQMPACVYQKANFHYSDNNQYVT